MGRCLLLIIFGSKTGFLVGFIGSALLDHATIILNINSCNTLPGMGPQDISEICTKCGVSPSGWNQPILPYLLNSEASLLVMYLLLGSSLSAGSYL